LLLRLQLHLVRGGGIALLDQLALLRRAADVVVADVEEGELLPLGRV